MLLRVKPASSNEYSSLGSRCAGILDSRSGESALTSMQDVGVVVERVDWAGRPVGIFVNGHEDGAYKVAWDAFLVLQNLGYVLPPFGIRYNLSSLTENTKADLRRLRDNSLAISRLNKVVDNLVHFMQLRVDRQLAWRPEGEKLRRVQYVAM